LYNHEDQLREELVRLQEQLKTVEAREKEEADKVEADKTTAAADTKDEAKPDDAPSSNGNVESGTSSLQATSVNTDSLDSDTTAVNTPLVSPTPVPGTQFSSLPKETPSEPLTSAFLNLQILHLQKLLAYLDTEFAPTKQKMLDLLANNDIKFSLLWCLFRLGSVITFKDYQTGLTMAGEVHPIPALTQITSAEYMRRGENQEFFEINARYIDYNGSCFYYAWQRMLFPSYL
jgi:hypothetical protein